MTLDSMEKLVSLAKRRGLIFQSSEIYGGLASTFDYGPYGVELKRNVKDAWWRAMVRERDDMVGLDAAILMHPQVWVASGHVAGFNDPMVECRNCQRRFRPDQILIQRISFSNSGITVYISGFSNEELEEKLREVTSRISRPLEVFQADPPKTLQARQDEIQELGRERPDLSVGALLGILLPNVDEIPCPSCGVTNSMDVTESRQFNLMFKTHVGPIESEDNIAYLRPETAQGIFVNFVNVQTTTRRKLPFGIAQIGKAFRNEITTGNFIFRTREFEQMEIEYFIPPEPRSKDEKDPFQWHEHWKQARMDWYVRYGIRPENLRFRDHDPDELAHYSRATADIEYRFPFGWGELEGIAYRTDFDLRQHQEHSGRPMTYYDEARNEHYIPHVIEPSCGVDRPLLAFLADSYVEEEVRGETRTVLKLHKHLAPIKVAVLPLSRNEKLVPKAREVYDRLRQAGDWAIEYDDAQSIGRRYRRQDEIGTPYCVTVDFQTVEEDDAVTIRDRDTMDQVRVPIAELLPMLQERLR